MADYDDKALDVLSSVIKTAVEQSIATAPFDKTIEGRVIASLGLGKYTVDINGEGYTVSAYGDSVYKINDIVRVAIPQNNFSKMYLVPIGINGTSGGGLVLGETSETAGRGDYTKIAYDHSQSDHKLQTYIHNQMVSSAVWRIEHNLGKYPSVAIVDSAGTVVIGDIEYTSDLIITVTFTAEFSGKAYLN